MTGQKALDKFDVVYNESYKDISRYVVLNANNIGDVKDILQNIYLEVYKNIDKVSDKNYVFGIAKNVLKKYYRFIMNETRYIPQNYISLNDEDKEKIYNLIETLEDLDDVQDVYHNMEE